MRILQSGRVTGKTTRAVEWLLAYPNRALVVLDLAEARRLREQVGQMHAHRIVTAYEAFTPGSVAIRGFDEVAVDNLDVILEAWLGVRVALATMGWDEQ